MYNKIHLKVFIVLISLLTVQVSTVEAKSNESNLNEQTDINSNNNIKKEKLRQEKRGEFETLIKIEGFEPEEINNFGYYYSGKNGEVIIQIKKNKDKNKEDKVYKAIDKLRTKYGESIVIVEYVTYSYEELNNLFEKVANSVNEMNIDSTKNPYLIRLLESENKIEFEINSVSTDQAHALKEQYGDNLIITQNPELTIPVMEKERNTDWNSLGAGIGILTAKASGCTSAGVAYKDSNYFLMTAGHCMSSYDNGTVGSLGGRETQYNTALGVDHLNSFASGYDFGLIRITTSSPITRIATNGLLRGNTSLYGYDAELKGNKSSFALYDEVCHSGLDQILRVVKLLLQE